MEIKEMNFEQLEERRGQLAEEISGADAERLDAINAELDAIEERKKEIKKEAEERAKAVEEIKKAPAPNPIIEERTDKKMTSREIRSTQEYINAYVDYVKGGYKDDTELRVLLSDNTQNGTVPVPTYIEDRIRTAWENDEIMSRVTRVFVKGNLKVGYEADAGEATIHDEGGDAVAEEELVLGIIELVPKMIKKWISVSDEVLALTGEAFLDYIYDELEYKIVKKAANQVIAKIAASSLVHDAGSAPALDVVLTAFAELSDEASDIVAIMSKSTYAAIKTAAKAANYAVDPFEGLPLVFNSTVTGVIVGDLKGVTANFPDGAEPKFVFDDKTLMTQDLVRILGKLYVGIDVTAPGRLATATISEESSGDDDQA